MQLVDSDVSNSQTYPMVIKTIPFMKRFLFVIALAVSTLVRADLLTELMIDKKYDPKYLSGKEIDSVLNGVDKGRYELQEKTRRQQYRYSYFAKYCLQDNRRNTNKGLSDSELRDVEISSDGKYIAYGKGQDLFLYKTDFNTEVAITLKRQSDVFNGMSDWLYEEEFGITKMYAFSPDNEQIAFIRLEESGVPTFTWQTYLNEGEESSKYPEEHSLRYPRSGERNAKPSVWVYDIRKKSLVQMRLPEEDDRYIPRLRWRETAEGNRLMVQTLNRDQTRMSVYSCNPKSSMAHLFYEEQSDKYFTDYSLWDEWQWLRNGQMVMLSEKDGWRRLYLCSEQGAVLRVLSPEGMDVTDVYGVDESSGVVYYQAAPVATERHIYSVTLKKGENVRLTNERGCYWLYAAKDFSRCVLRYESDVVPPTYTLCNLSKRNLKVIRSLENNAVVAAKWKGLNMPPKEFVRIGTERGDSLDAWILRPAEASETNKRPVVMFQYSGPASQRVLNRWHHRIGYVLVQMGYVVVNADPRGTDCRGREWRNETYLALGKKEAEDHLSVARYIQTLPYVDGSRIAMAGWSYGGYQTIRTMCEQDATNPLVRCGIAIAPVTDWRLYDTGYTERYMRRPMVNEDGYKQADLTAMADRLTGRLLLVHGMADDNVHAQNTWLLTEALVNAGKQFDMQVYPDDNHNLRRGNHYLHLHQRIVKFLKENL